MNINPVNIDKTVEYQNNLQARFKDVISSKDEHSSMFSGAWGDGTAVKVEVEGLFFMSSPFFCFLRRIMEQKRLNLYTVNMKYIRNLHNQGDDRVFSVSPQVGKETDHLLG